MVASATKVTGKMHPPKSSSGASLGSACLEENKSIASALQIIYCFSTFSFWIYPKGTPLSLAINLALLRKPQLLNLEMVPLAMTKQKLPVLATHVSDHLCEPVPKSALFLCIWNKDYNPLVSSPVQAPLRVLLWSCAVTIPCNRACAGEATGGFCLGLLGQYFFQLKWISTSHTANSSFGWPFFLYGRITNAMLPNNILRTSIFLFLPSAENPSQLEDKNLLSSVSRLKGYSSPSHRFAL